MMQKRNLWAVLAAVLLMVLATNGAMADEDVFTSGDYQYCILEDGTAEITNYFGRDSVVSIPETLDGKTVTSIGESAFSGCRALTNIKLPDSVTSMGVNPFAGCGRLKNIQVSPEQPVFTVIDGVLFNKEEKSLICYPAGKQEEAYEVPQGIQQIKSEAFYGCSALTSIELPDSVTSIGEYAFYDCSALTSIELPDGVTSIGDQAFWGCNNLTMTVQRDSYAAQYAKDNNLKYTYPDANDWLNN